MQYLVAGTGGVGGYFGGVLARHGLPVWFLARGAHLEAMRSSGLHIRSSSGEWTVPAKTMTDDAAKARPVGVVLFCVKSYDTEAAARQIASALTPDTVVISLQNGIDNEEKLQQLLPRITIYGGAAYVSARITAPGEITETGGLQRIVMGPIRGPIDRQATQVHSAFVNAGIRTELRQDIRTELWKKYIFITAMGSMTAVTRMNHGEMLASKDTMDLVFTAMEEAGDIAAAKGVAVEPLNRQKVIEGLQRFDRNTRSSMYYDLAAGKPLELEALNGTIVRMGKELGIPTPVHEMIYSSLLPHHRKNLQGSSS